MLAASRAPTPHTTHPTSGMADSSAVAAAAAAAATIASRSRSREAALFLATAAVVRSMLGISPSAWEEAQTILGETPAAIVVACILQRGTAIRSAGGYLRGLTRKAEAGEFSLGPILMTQINSHLNEKRRA